MRNDNWTKFPIRRRKETARGGGGKNAADAVGVAIFTVNLKHGKTRCCCCCTALDHNNLLIINLMKHLNLKIL
jgi:hypothetical protein